MSDTKFSLLFLAVAFIGCADIPNELREEAKGGKKCNGKPYTEYQFCSDGKVYDFCAGSPYNPSVVACCNNHQYTISTEFCSGTTVYLKCGGQKYDVEKEQCQNGVVQGKCGTSWYNPETQFCSGSEVYSKCGGSAYNPATQQCQNGAIQGKCGTSWYSPETQFCWNDRIYSKCGGSAYNLSTQFCSGNEVYSRCGGDWYDPATQFCSDNEVYLKCDDLEYNPAMQYCSGGILRNYFVDSRDNKTYKIVVIGTQTWMVENLNYDASDSKCYGDDEANCDRYGRLYDWETATTVCPPDWHLPSDVDWNILMKFVNPSCSDNSDCAGAGTKLKATIGWSNNGNGQDTYGFAALPGGCSSSDGNFANVGYSGYWWSSTSESVYYRRMNGGQGAYGNDAYWYKGSKNFLFSVRCLQD